MRRLNKQTIEGILGTIIFHLLLAIVIMILKMNAIQKPDDEGFIIIFEDEDLQELLNPKEEENISTDGQEEIRRNIAVNQNQQQNKLSPEENLKRMLESMKKFNESAEDMLDDDEHFKMNEKLQEEIKDRSMIDSSILLQEEKRIKEEAQYFYEGPTNIYYSFNEGNRVGLYLHLPVYKCEGGGMVSLIFDINRDGDVVSAAFDRQDTFTKDECLLSAAKESLMKSKFNKDSQAPQHQTGKITYHFVPQ